MAGCVRTEELEALIAGVREAAEPEEAAAAVAQAGHTAILRLSHQVASSPPQPESLASTHTEWSLASAHTEWSTDWSLALSHTKPFSRPPP